MTETDIVVEIPPPRPWRYLQKATFTNRGKIFRSWQRLYIEVRIAEDGKDDDGGRPYQYAVELVEGAARDGGAGFLARVAAGRGMPDRGAAVLVAAEPLGRRKLATSSSLF